MIYLIVQLDYTLIIWLLNKLVVAYYFVVCVFQVHVDLVAWSEVSNARLGFLHKVIIRSSW